MVWITAQQKDNSNLRQRFHQKHPGHDGVLWEMPLKEGLIDCDILETHHMSLAVRFEDPVHQQKRIALRKYSKDLMHFLNRIATSHIASKNGDRLPGLFGRCYFVAGAFAGAVSALTG